VTNSIRGRYTLDVAHLIDTAIVRRHIVCLTRWRCLELEVAERLMPGRVYTEVSRYVPGDQSWAIEYANPDLVAA
jgi:hypothetical protein